MVEDDGSASSGRSTSSRRAFVRGTAATGVAATLAGCGGLSPVGSAEGSGQRVVNFAANSTIASAWSKLEPVLHEVGLPDDVTVEVLPGAWASGKRQSKYQIWLAADREKPDMFLMDNGWTIPFIAREQLLNLEKHLSDDLVSRIRNDYFDSIVRTAIDRETDSLYGVPLWIDLPTIQYRKDLVREAGYDPDDEAWATEGISWKRFAEVTKTVQRERDLSYGFTFQAQSYAGLACCDFLEFMSSWGGAYFGSWKNLFGPIGERPVTVDERPTVDAVRMLRTFIHGSDDPAAIDGYAGGIAPQAVLQWTEEPSRKPFTNGRAVMHRNWPYSIQINGAEDAFGEDLGVMPIPYATTEEQSAYPRRGGPVAAVGGWNLTVNPNAADRNAAIAVVEAMASPKFRFKLFEEAGYTPPDPTLLETKRARNVPVMGRYLDQLKVAGKNAIPRPVTVVWPQQSTAIASKVNATLGRSMPPERALSSLAGQLEEIEAYVGGTEG